MDDDLDAIHRDAEQMMRFDRLQALVHQRRRVDGDLAAHPPRRVCQRFLDADGAQLLVGSAAERTARRRHDYSAHVAQPVPGEALEKG